MASTQVQIVGNSVAAPDLKHVGAKSTAVAEFTVASTPRVFNQSKNEFEDGSTTFLKVKAWGRLAEDATDKIDKGTPVVVVGKLAQSNFETKAGEKRSVFELVAEDIGVSVRAKSSDPF